MIPKLALFCGVSSITGTSLLTGLLLALQIVLSPFSRIQLQLHVKYFHLLPIWIITVDLSC